MRSNRLYVRIFCSLGVVNMLDRKVYTKSVSSNLEFFCSKAKGLRIVRDSVMKVMQRDGSPPGSLEQIQ